MRRDMSGELHIALGETLARLSERRQVDRVWQRDGDLTIELYRPVGRDRQVPHDRDEFYVIATGNGTFRRQEETIAFAPGDLLFVPAWMEHRFETFSDDFAAWVVFFGPVQDRR
jgi:mannose-6-phosphate isomerase-like protein (cupin superfamily)